jgi:hypothetical protein
MAFLGNIVKGTLATKALQIARQQWQKPENQKRVNDAITKLKNRRSGGRPAV